MSLVVTRSSDPSMLSSRPPFALFFRESDKIVVDENKERKFQV